MAANESLSRRLTEYDRLTLGLAYVIQDLEDAQNDPKLSKATKGALNGILVRILEFHQPARDNQTGRCADPEDMRWNI